VTHHYSASCSKIHSCGAADRSVVQSACRCLLAYWYRFLLLMVQSARRRLLHHLVVLVLVAASIDRSSSFGSLVHCCCRSFSRSVGALPLTSLLDSVFVGDRSVGMLPLTSLTPVVHIAGSTGLSVLLLLLLFAVFRNPADSHDLVLRCQFAPLHSGNAFSCFPSWHLLESSCRPHHSCSPSSLLRLRRIFFLRITPMALLSSTVGSSCQLPTVTLTLLAACLLMVTLTLSTIASASCSRGGYISTSTPVVCIVNANSHVDSVGYVQFNVASLCCSGRGTLFALFSS
jgi:hypothetical protein